MFFFCSLKLIWHSSQIQSARFPTAASNGPDAVVDEEEVLCSFVRRGTDLRAAQTLMAGEWLAGEPVRGISPDRCTWSSLTKLDSTHPVVALWSSFDAMFLLLNSNRITYCFTSCESHDQALCICTHSIECIVQSHMATYFEPHVVD